MTPDELLRAIFEGKRPALYAQMADWVKASRRYRAFAENYRDKIRKKLRSAADAEYLLDVACELETAYRLLVDKRLEVTYEKYAAEKQRGPDFTVAYRVNTLFNLEVTRLRATAPAELVPKLAETVCEKLGQMPPGAANVLLIVGTDDAAAIADAVKALKLLADQKQEQVFTRRDFKNARDFLNQLARLSAVLLRDGEQTALWHNPTAKHPLPKDIANLLLRL